MNESKAGFNAREYDEYLISAKDVNDVGRGEEIEDSFDELFLEFKAATVQGYKWGGGELVVIVVVVVVGWMADIIITSASF
ncbi:hypothetical protein V1477_020101 [Vespula maculifrons]|uniref:Uncharacterized protein n=1 Tax=Vespula maculifrons TaxID=7453 RepID=A0ABD2ALK7_VESMC